MKKIIVFDTENVAYLENRIFNSAVASQFPGAMALHRFYELANSSGYELLTSDLFLQKKPEGKAFVISEQVTSRTKLLTDAGALLVAVYSLETPSFAWKFYRDVYKETLLYKHAFLFSGASKWVDPERVNFHPTLFPQPNNFISEEGLSGWDERRFLVMINSNLIRYVRPLQFLASLSKHELRDELYSERRRAIRHFSGGRNIHLYGRGWEKKKFLINKRDYLAALSCYKGECGDKIKTLSKYRFAICFENAEFSGYITEKIFDCFYSGCVPVYLGAPDILDFIPKSCFIDYRDFQDYGKLEKYLLDLTPDDYEKFRTSVQSFLRSEAFERFSYNHFASNLLSAVNEHG
jgi:alpha(1,3/1,4) fucosyltransferase